MKKRKARKTRKTRKVSWKATAEAVERERDAARAQLENYRPYGEAFEQLRGAIIEQLRDEIREMVEEEIRGLDIHLG